jgi:hypothetical protein
MIPTVKFYELSSAIFDKRVAADEDDANNNVLDDDDSGLPATSNTCSDGLSWLDGGKSDISNASRDKFDVSKDIDLAAPILRDMLSDHAMPTVRRDAALPLKAVANGEPNTKETEPVKWQVKF